GRADLYFHGTQHEMRYRALRPLSVESVFYLQGWTRFLLRPNSGSVQGARVVMIKAHSPKPRLAVWKFSSCDGCQLSLLDCEDELLALADKVEIAYFAEASSNYGEGPYDISLVEGSIA